MRNIRKIRLTGARDIRIIRDMRKIDATTAAKNLGGLIEEVLGGESFTITRYGKPIAVLGPAVLRAHDPQAEAVIAAAPSHRPVPTDAIIVNTASDTTTSGTPRTWAQRNPEQAERDKILGGMKPNKRKDEIPK